MVVDVTIHPDTNTRRRARLRRVAATAGAAAAAKLISSLSILVTIPLALHYLGLERFGVWTVIASFSVVLSFADFGLGNGLVTKLAGLHGRNDRAAMREAISNCFALLFGSALFLFSLVVIVHPLIDWGYVFNVASPSVAAEARAASFIYASCLAAGIPISCIRSIQFGLQEGFFNSLWQGLTSVLGLAGLYFAIKLQVNLPVLVAVFGGVPLLVGIANMASFFIRNRDLLPSPFLVQIDTMRGLIGIGAMFFVMQVSLASAFGFDSLIIAQIAGPDAVAQYAVVERLFALISTGVVMLASPLWPAYGEAIAAHDHGWVRRIFVRSLLVCIGIASAGGVFLFFAGKVLIGYWVGHAVAVPVALMVGLAAWRIVEAGGTAVSMYLNGRGIITRQALILAIASATIITAKILLTRQFGIVGMPWASATCYFIFAIIPSAFILKYDPVLGRPATI